MTRGRSHPAPLKAEALRRYYNNESYAKIAKAIGVSRYTVVSWIKELDPAHQPLSPAKYRRDVQELGQLVYDTIVVTLESLRARAIETGRPEWIKNQTADQIAALDHAQWDRVIRVISAFRPEPDASTEAEPDQDGGTIVDQPEHHRNGAVDPAD